MQSRLDALCFLSLSLWVLSVWETLPNVCVYVCVCVCVCVCVMLTCLILTVWVYMWLRSENRCLLCLSICPLFQQLSVLSLFSSVCCPCSGRGSHTVICASHSNPYFPGEMCLVLPSCVCCRSSTVC